MMTDKPHDVTEKQVAEILEGKTVTIEPEDGELSFGFTINIPEVGSIFVIPVCYYDYPEIEFTFKPLIEKQP